MATEWHYGQGEEQHGPVPLEELKQLVASGQVQPTDMVWNPDMPDWLPAGEVEELFPKQRQELVTEPVPEPSPSVSSTQPCDKAVAIRTLLTSHKTAVGIAALCVVGLVVLVSFLLSRGNKEPKQSVSETAAKNLSPEQPKDLPENVANAMTTLTTAPDDAEANLVVGGYHCFTKGEWDKGLPMLARGGDTALKQLATTELTNPTTAEEQLKLGNSWWDFGATKVNLIWKSSRTRAAYWYQKALDSGAGKNVELDQRLAAIKHLPEGFDVVSRHTGSHPDKDSYDAQCTNLSLEVTKRTKEDVPQRKLKAAGSGIAGLELKGVRLLELKVKGSPDLEGANTRKDKNIFAGFMVDYQTVEGYTKRVALCLTAFNKDRDVKLPGWGKNSVPDDYVDLGKKEAYQLDLQTWAPSGWKGDVCFGVVLQQRTPGTFLKAELIPHAASEKMDTLEETKVEKPAAAGGDAPQGKKGKGKK